MITFGSIYNLVDDIHGIIRDNTISESETISDLQIEFWVNQYRTLLLKQDLDKGRSANPDYIQEINSIPLIVEDYNNTNSGIKTNKYRYRTSIQIPKTLDLHFDNAITSVSDMLNNQIQLSTEQRAVHQKYRKYTADNTVAYLSNGYIYVEGNQLLEYIKVRGVFEYPNEAIIAQKHVIGIPEVVDPNDKYPIPANMLTTLKSMILKNELAIETSVPSDKTNDANNIVTPNAVQKGK